LRKRGGDKMLEQPTKSATPTNELYTLLALLYYARRELGTIDEFAEYFVDLAIYQLSQRLPGAKPDDGAGRKPD
jgi:hypothetical protein